MTDLQHNFGDLAALLPHLPADKQDELARVLSVLFEEFEDARKLGVSETKKLGRILHVVLFGSFARDSWVEDEASGYVSDYDLLIVVNHPSLTDEATYWYKADERLIRDATIGREVNFIVHSLEEVNGQLARGQYFFSDIVRDGISLYCLDKKKALIDPGRLDKAEAEKQSAEYFEHWSEKTSGFISAAQHMLEEKNLPLAAFMTHQAIESAYNCLLLTKTLYSPDSHNIKFLRSLAEDLDDRLKPLWSRETKQNRATFELLKRAYVEARYSLKYEITREQLDWALAEVQRLDALVREICG